MAAPTQPATSFSDMTVCELLKRIGAIQASAARGMATMTGPAYEQSAATFARGVFAIEMIQRVIDGGCNHVPKRKRPPQPEDHDERTEHRAFCHHRPKGQSAGAGRPLRW